MILIIGIVGDMTLITPIPACLSVESQNCINSFHNFAYEIPIPFRTPETLVPPTLPWQHVETIPPHHIPGYFPTIHQLNVITVREIRGKAEVWLRGVVYGNDPALPRIVVLIRYDETDTSWEYISSETEVPNLSIWEVFVTSNGDVWGTPNWIYYDTREGIYQSLPILYRFDETDKRFAVVEGVVEYTRPANRYNYHFPYITLDQADMFWIFNMNNLIYNYNPVLGTTESYEFDVSTTVLDVTFDSTGQMVILTGTIGGGGLDYRLWEFQPINRRLSAIILPGRDWMIYNGILFDRENRLWIGANGYRDNADTWHLINASPDELGYELRWAPATPVLASSDGRIWYSRFLDTSGWAEGTAWYDPETDQGCWFTHFPANVVEDHQQRVWLAADGSIYSLNLAD